MIVGYVLYDVKREQYFEKFGPAPDGRGIVPIGTASFHKAAKYDLNEYVTAWESLQLAPGYSLMTLCLKQQGEI